jgi:RNA polymerase sigma-70 factor, ECF subfamily
MVHHSTTTREDEFEALFREFVPAVRRQARVWVPPDEVDDVVEATFVTAWQRFEQIPQTSQRAWLFGVARNHCRNRWRARGRASSLVDAIEAARPRLEASLHDQDVDPGAVDSIIRALRRLSDSDREIMVLSIWQEMTPTEIAMVVGVEAGTIRVRLHRLRRHLAVELQSVFGDGDVA